jgi:hypothetical protein
MYTLNGVKITGKLVMYRCASGIRYCEKRNLIKLNE